MTPTRNTYLPESVGKNFDKFCDEKVPSRQTVHNLVNKLRSMGLLMEKK
jgi:hypothetical protein